MLGKRYGVVTSDVRDLTERRNGQNQGATESGTLMYGGGSIGSACEQFNATTEESVLWTQRKRGKRILPTTRFNRLQFMAIANTC